ncbi:MAG: type II toxin-antitoxin system antitoxin SocA domain-containing protein [Sphingorhabdus sp.]|uniref:Panacea domain-containing protein n=1 Tax=Sphingorhabdus sp. TaxID=1902408 RepID=UPI003C8F711D
MTYDARQIANWFIERAAKDGRVLSIMSLLKLAYIAHGWNLEMRNAPLFSNRVEAWRYGPVIPDVYNAFRSQGINPTKPVEAFSSPSEAVDVSFLEQIYKIYGSLSAFRLSELTHEPGGPWETASKLGGSYAEIPNDLILGHYVQKRKLANQANG